MEEPSAVPASKQFNRLRARFGKRALSDKDWRLALRVHDETLARLKRISDLFAKAAGSKR